MPKTAIVFAPGRTGRGQVMTSHKPQDISPNLFRKTGLLFSSMSAVYLMVFITARLFRADMPDAPDIGVFWLLTIALCFALFTLSALYASLSWLQPLILFLITPIPMFNQASSMFSLGVFIAGMILFFRLGYFRSKKIPRFLLAIAYFYLCEVVAGLGSKAGVVDIMIPILFMTVFLAFLMIVYGDRWIIYLKEPKPSLSLASLKITHMESEYLKALLAGRSIKEIAIDRGVKESTVRNTLARVYKKFHVSDKSALMAKCESYRIL